VGQAPPPVNAVRLRKKSVSFRRRPESPADMAAKYQREIPAFAGMTNLNLTELGSAPSLQISMLIHCLSNHGRC